MTNQIVSTPIELLRAIEGRFGPICFDLAANKENNVVRRLYSPEANGTTEAGNSMLLEWEGFSKYFFGPGSSIGENAFLKPWHGLADLAWLNPPFSDIEPWAAACAHAVKIYRQRIALLIPASVCTKYYIDYVDPFAYVLKLSPRPFKKEVRDCVLALYEPAGYRGCETWLWR